MDEVSEIFLSLLAFIKVCTPERDQLVLSSELHDPQKQRSN
jgi:hypothetical protein